MVVEKVEQFAKIQKIPAVKCPTSMPSINDSTICTITFFIDFLFVNTDNFLIECVHYSV